MPPSRGSSRLAPPSQGSGFLPCWSVGPRRLVSQCNSRYDGRAWSTAARAIRIRTALALGTDRPAVLSTAHASRLCRSAWSLLICTKILQTPEHLRVSEYRKHVSPGIRETTEADQHMIVTVCATVLLTSTRAGSIRDLGPIAKVRTPIRSARCNEMFIIVPTPLRSECASDSRAVRVIALRLFLTAPDRSSMQRKRR